MARRVFWRSWSKLEADYELQRFNGLPFEYEWVNAHTNLPNHDDIWLTTNGYDWKNLPHRASLYAESYQYLKNEYIHFPSDTKWSHRFHFNPTMAKCSNTTLHLISCFWQNEMDLFRQTANNKQPEFNFGMVLSRKPIERNHACEFGWFRTKIVEAGKGRSMRYYGGGWPGGDPNFGGEAYVHGHRGTPAKFHDARILMTKAKFVFCVENIHDPIYAVNYMTEKIFHGFLSASVPIYAGCWNVEQLIPPDIFIDLRKFNMDPKAAMDHCEQMSDTEYRGYLDRIGTWLDGPGKAFSMESRFVELDKKLAGVFG